MDLDRFIATNQPAWQRLDELAGRARLRVAALSADELDELIALYQRVSGHLSVARTHYDDDTCSTELTTILARARGVIYRERTSPVVALGRFFTRAFPAAVWQARRFIATATLAFLVPAIGMGVWLSFDDAARNATIDPETAALIAESQFADYYSSDAAATFQANITTNNIRVGLLSFAGGIFAGIPTLLLMGFNGMSIGAVAAVMHDAGEAGQFWGLILPHGMLELSAIWFAGGAGLQIGWAVISPGDRRRSEAVARAGQRSLVIVLGASLAFILAAIIEAWVTPSGLPTAVRIAIGVAAFSALMLWGFGLGRSAVAEGYTGRLGERPSEGAGRLDVEVGVGQLSGERSRRGVDDSSSSALQA